MISNPSYEAAFRAWFGITQAEASVLMTLFDREGKLITREDLARDSGVTPAGASVILMKLRTSLEVEAIDCVKGEGYCLTETGLGECRAVLWQTGEELRMAGVDKTRADWANRVRDIVEDSL